MKRLCLVAVAALVTGALALVPTAGAVTTQAAYQATLEYSKRACNHDRFVEGITPARVATKTAA